MRRRHVHHGDGVSWLREAEMGPRHAIVTSLPDRSELPHLDFEAWRTFFVSTVRLACSRIDANAVAIFYQTDIKVDGRWVDKAFLVQCGAHDADAHVLWHKIVCRVAPGTTTYGRPAYAHLVCVSRSLRLDPGRSTPDVIAHAGAMTWPRAMPLAACEASCRFISNETACDTVVDPFCGVGTILAVANAHGLSAIGVELSRKRANKARTIVL